MYHCPLLRRSPAPLQMIFILYQLYYKYFLLLSAFFFIPHTSVDFVTAISASYSPVSLLNRFLWHCVESRSHSVRDLSGTCGQMCRALEWLMQMWPSLVRNCVWGERETGVTSNVFILSLSFNIWFQNFKCKRKVIWQM